MENRPILSENQSKTCRICLDNNDPEDFIRPCLCSGGSAFVHRKCLDNWRAMNKNGRAFNYCDVCQFQFVIEPVIADQAADNKRLLIYRLLVTRDITLIVLAIQAVIIGMTFIIQALDKNSHALRDLFPPSANSLGIYYLCSLILFLALLGFFGLIGMCVSSANNDPIINDRNNCGCCYCFFFDLNCNGNCNGGGGGGDGAGVLLIILLIIVVAFAILGIFVGIVLGIMCVKKILQRHTNKLWLRQEAKKYIVKDFTNNLDELQNISTTRSGNNSPSVLVELLPLTTLKT
jgi:hypothetical protein